MKQTLYSQSTVDVQTGEVIQKQWLTREAKNTQHFVKMYLEDLSTLHHLANSDFRTLYSIAEFLEYNTNQFFLNKERRQELAIKANCKLNTINHSIAKLVKKNLLLKVGGNLYQMNPKIFFNGEEIERSKYLEVTFRYNICRTC